MKTCSKCGFEGKESLFVSPGSRCKKCIAAYNKKWRNENPDQCKTNRSLWRDLNVEHVKKYNKKQREKHAEEYAAYMKEYAKNNPALKEYQKEYHKNPEKRKRINFLNSQNTKRKMKENAAFRIARYVSNEIWRALKDKGGTKNGRSIWNYLPYTIIQLVQHIELLFSHPDNLDSNGKVWMNWNNQGTHIGWDDNDPSTWRWQLDHITPHSDLPYDSIEHPIFLKAWALSNLRPLSAKQNHEDGVNRTRHQKHK